MGTRTLGKANVKRGFLISIEGCDRSGKSTQCQLTREWLAGIFLGCPENQGRAQHDLVQYLKFPDRTTPVGQIINSYLGGSASLPDEAIHLLFSANRWELRDKMLDALASGTSIILDRYVHSGVAYSAAKGMNLEWCKAPDAGLPAPDLVLFIDLPVEVAQARSGYGGERYERLEFQAKVRENFWKLKDDTWIIIDGNQSVENLAAALQQAITNRLFQSDNPLVMPVPSIAWKCANKVL